jgi:hypothetical protein
VGPDDAARLAFGQSVPCDATSAAAEGPLVVLLGDELVAIAERTGERLVPRKVFNSAEPAA